MGVTTRDDTRATRTATRGRQIGISETQTLGRQPINIRGANTSVTVAAEILRANVVADDENKIGPRILGEAASASPATPTAQSVSNFSY